MREDAHEKLMEVIKESLKHYRAEENGIRSRTFYFCAPVASQKVLFSDPNVEDVCGIFRSLGHEPQPVDDIPHSFNFNRLYYEVADVASFRNFSFVLPESDDLDALARIVEYEHDGLVQFIVYDED